MIPMPEWMRDRVNHPAVRGKSAFLSREICLYGSDIQTAPRLPVRESGSPNPGVSGGDGLITSQEMEHKWNVTGSGVCIAASVEVIRLINRQKSAADIVAERLP